MAYTAAYTALFAFGDSLPDAGNDWIVDGNTDPVSPYYQGHFITRGISATG
jgi:hypothetical protein